jgi:hypothetical protein
MNLSSDENQSIAPLMKKAPYSIRLDPKQRDALEAWAKSEHRTLANLVEMILTERLAAREVEDAATKKRPRSGSR